MVTFDGDIAIDLAGLCVRKDITTVFKSGAYNIHHSSLLARPMDPQPDSDASSTSPETQNLLGQLAGHVGHLSASQQDALDTFRANLIEAGLYTSPSAAAGDSDDNIQASHDDQTLLCVVNPTPPVILDEGFCHHQFIGAFSGRGASTPPPHRNSLATQRRGGRSSTSIGCLLSSTRKSLRIQRGFLRGGLGGGIRCVSTPLPPRPSWTFDVV